MSYTGPQNYRLKYAQAQQFYGYEHPADVLVAMADFDNNHINQTTAVQIDFDNEDLTWGGVLTWEDCSEA